MWWRAQISSISHFISSLFHFSFVWVYFEIKPNETPTSTPTFRYLSSSLRVPDLPTTQACSLILFMKRFTVHSGFEERRQILIILICVFDYPVWVAVCTVYHSYCFGAQVALRLSCGRRRKRFFIWLITQRVMLNAFDFIILRYSMFVCVCITADIKPLTCYI